MIEISRYQTDDQARVTLAEMVFGLHRSTIKIIVKVECERLKKQLERQKQRQRQAS